MALTPSTMTELGTPAPDFSLADVVSGDTTKLEDLRGSKGLLVMFICSHCPYVIHVREELARLGRDYEQSPISIVAISSNDAEKYPDDNPENLRKMALELDFRFSLLFDEDQSVAKAFGAACTPDFFLFDGDNKLVYRGQLDDARPGSDVPVTGGDLRAAIDAVLEGRPVAGDQKPSMGCNIKWKPGNEPSYFQIS